MAVVLAPAGVGCSCRSRSGRRCWSRRPWRRRWPLSRSRCGLRTRRVLRLDLRRWPLLRLDLGRWPLLLLELRRRPLLLLLRLRRWPLLLLLNLRHRPLLLPNLGCRPLLLLWRLLTRSLESGSRRVGSPRCGLRVCRPQGWGGVGGRTSRLHRSGAAGGELVIKAGVVAWPCGRRLAAVESGLASGCSPSPVWLVEVARRA